MLTILRSSPLVDQPNLERAARWIFTLTNRERAFGSVGIVQPHRRLDAAAAFHGVDMARRGFFAHLDPEGRGPQDRMRLVCPELIGGCGENLAWYPALPEEMLAREVVKGWMNSKGHHDNLLASSHTHMGLHVLQHERQVYVTQLFGGLVAELLEQGLPIRINDREKRELRFGFYGSFPRNDLMLMVEVPDKHAHFPAGFRHFTKGAAMLKPNWDGTNTFHMEFTAMAGRGHYRILVGKASTFQFFQSGIDLNVD